MEAKSKPKLQRQTDHRGPFVAYSRMVEDRKNVSAKYSHPLSTPTWKRARKRAAIVRAGAPLIQKQTPRYYNLQKKTKPRPTDRIEYLN